MTDELLAEFRMRLAAVIAPDQLQHLTPFELEGTLSETSNEALEPMLAALAAAGMHSPVVNGKPRVLKVDAWMCHAGYFNKNGHGFTEEDLEEAAATLFQAPYLGIMDWNHSSVFQDRGDPKMIGVWYDARYEYNPVARDGAGAYGIRVTGTVFSWLFPDYAEKLVEEQAKTGRLRFSMMCLARGAERAEWHGQMGTVLRKPVFFANALMIKPEADTSAVGRGTWDEPEPEYEDELAAAAALAAAQAASTEDAHMEEKLAELEALKATLEAQVNELKATSATQAEAMQALLDSHESLKGSVAELTAKLDEATTVKDTLSTANEALTTELAAANATIEALTAERAALTERLAAIEATAAAAAKKELVARRLAELGEDFLKAHGKRDEAKRSKVEERFASLTDEQWEEEKELLGLAPVRLSYAARSRAEGGVLPSGDQDHAGSVKDKLAALIKS